MKLLAEFTIEGLPKTVNAIGRKHWAVKVKEARRWHLLVLDQCNRKKISGKMFKNVHLELTRYSSVEPDFDNLASSFKHVLDGLVSAEVFEDDKPSVIGCPVFRWTKTPRGEGRISVKIFQPEEPSPFESGEDI